jgi:hyaluronan synthase
MVITFFFIINGISLVLFLFQLVFSGLYHKRLKNKSANSITTEVPNISVVIPYYNESNDNLQKTIDSIDAQEGVNTEIILISDGNKKSAKVQIKSSFQHVILRKNKGKRNALHVGSKRCKYDYVAVIDSDTILEKNALSEIYNCLIEQNAGAVCGTIELKNENQNILTRMIGAMYWFAFQMERASQSYFGAQTICSGALSLYKTDVFKQGCKSLLLQHVGSVKCVAGDDKHLTTQTQLQGFKTSWCPTAIAYTDTPFTLKSFAKQQIRWARSFVLESMWIIRRHSKFTNIFKFFVFKNIFKFVYMMFVLLGIIFVFLHLNIFFIGLIILKALIIGYFSKSFSKLLSTFVLAIIGYLILSPILIWAAITYRKSGWLTRSTVNK